MASRRVVQTLDEAVSIVREIGSPYIQTEDGPRSPWMSILVVMVTCLPPGSWSIVPDAPRPNPAARMYPAITPLSQDNHRHRFQAQPDGCEIPVMARDDAAFAVH